MSYVMRRGMRMEIWSVKYLEIWRILFLGFEKTTMCKMKSLNSIYLWDWLVCWKAIKWNDCTWTFLFINKRDLFLVWLGFSLQVEGFSEDKCIESFVYYLCSFICVYLITRQKLNREFKVTVPNSQVILKGDITPSMKYASWPTTI